MIEIMHQQALTGLASGLVRMIAITHQEALTGLASGLIRGASRALTAGSIRAWYRGRLRVGVVDDLLESGVQLRKW